MNPELIIAHKFLDDLRIRNDRDWQYIDEEIKEYERRIESLVERKRRIEIESASVNAALQTLASSAVL